MNHAVLLRSTISGAATSLREFELAHGHLTTCRLNNSKVISIDTAENYVTAAAASRYYPVTNAALDQFPSGVHLTVRTHRSGRLHCAMTDIPSASKQFSGASSSVQTDTLAGQTSTDDLIRLLGKAADGDRAAFAALYQATHRKLFGIVLRIMKRQTLAEEVLQEVYLRIWDRAGSYTAGVSSPITWMAVIARNRALDELRRKVPTDTGDDSVLDSIADSAHTGPVERAAMGQELGRLEDCISQVGGEQADMVRLAYLDGLSRQALAERFQQPVGTVKVWLHRSLKQIKSCLGAASS